MSNIAVGGIDGVLFFDGWAPGNATSVLVTLPDGAEIEVTDLVAVEGFDVLFFLERLPPTDNGEPELPITAVSLDSSGGVIADFATAHVRSSWRQTRLSKGRSPLRSKAKTLEKQTWCGHEQTIASAVAGMERLVCESCGHVSIKLVSEGITQPGIPTPRHEVGSQ